MKVKRVLIIMKSMFHEYGTYIIALFTFVFFVGVFTFFKGAFKENSTEFISTITGADSSYVETP